MALVMPVTKQPCVSLRHSGVIGPELFSSFLTSPNNSFGVVQMFGHINLCLNVVSMLLLQVER